MEAKSTLQHKTEVVLNTVYGILMTLLHCTHIGYRPIIYLLSILIKYCRPFNHWLCGLTEAPLEGTNVFCFFLPYYYHLFTGSTIEFALNNSMPGEQNYRNKFS